MGVDTNIWRMRIGCFCPRKPSVKFRVAVLSVSLSMATLFVLAMLTVTVSGDVETNPGPDTPVASVKYTVKELSEMVKGLQVEVKCLKELVQKLTNSLETKTDELSQKTDDLENRSRRDNIVVYGIPEKTGEERETWDDCEAAVRTVLVEDLEMEDAADDGGVGIERAHRVGKRGDKPRPIVVKLTHSKTKAAILTGARQKLRKSEIKISEDYSFQVRQKRKGLIPEMIKARKEEKEAYLRFDKLVINGKTFQFDLKTGNIKEFKSR